MSSMMEADFTSLPTRHNTSAECHLSFLRFVFMCFLISFGNGETRMLKQASSRYVVEPHWMEQMVYFVPILGEKKKMLLLHPTPTHFFAPWTLHVTYKNARWYDIVFFNYSTMWEMEMENSYFVKRLDLNNPNFIFPCMFVNFSRPLGIYLFQKFRCNRSLWHLKIHVTYSSEILFWKLKHFSSCC